jgi:membrane-associated phospholipid phosphatase
MDAMRGVSRCVTVSSFVLAALFTAPSAVAQSAPGYVFDSPAGEGAFTALLALPHVAHLFPYADTGWGPSSSRQAHDGYDLASDFTGNWTGATWMVATGYGLEVGYYDRNGAGDSMARALRTTLIDLQAFTLATGVTAILKHATGRCRPRDFHDGACDEDATRNAFPSGHVAPPASIAAVHLTLALRSEDSAGHRWGAFGVAEASALATVALRMLAGAHSWEDVLVGLAIGHLAGASVAAAHPMEAIEPQAPLVGGPPAAPAMLHWSARF